MKFRNMWQKQDSKQRKLEKQTLKKKEGKKKRVRFERKRRLRSEKEVLNKFFCFDFFF